MEKYLKIFKTESKLSVGNVKFDFQRRKPGLQKKLFEEIMSKSFQTLFKNHLA